MRAADHILTDLARKAGEDVSERVRLTAQLLSDPQDRFYVALSATASAAGLATGFAEQCADGQATAEEAADTLWMILRPMVVMIAGGGSADFRKLLRAAPKGRRE